MLFKKSLILTGLLIFGILLFLLVHIIQDPGSKTNTIFTWGGSEPNIAKILSKEFPPGTNKEKIVAFLSNYEKKKYLFSMTIKDNEIYYIYYSTKYHFLPQNVWNVKFTFNDLNELTTVKVQKSIRGL